MEVEAIDDHGKLEFVRPLKLKHERVRLGVTVPDDEVEVTSPSHPLVSEDVLVRARAMRERLDAIRDAPFPPDETLADLTQNQLDRIAAFELGKIADSWICFSMST
jgi:hypothetical protein